jgi:hypothetical protein
LKPSSPLIVYQPLHVNLRGKLTFHLFIFQNCVVWAAQILCGNAILGYSVVFLEAAGFSSIQAFDVNIALSACYIIGGIICWLLFPHFGRSTIYMTGMTFMFFCLLAIGGLGWASGTQYQLAIGILLVISTLVNMISIGPVCYPIVAETPSGRLRYKTITIGRFVYNLTGIFQNSVTPHMISANCTFSLLLLLVLWLLTDNSPSCSLELGRQNRALLCWDQPSLQSVVLVPPARDQGPHLR